MTCRVALKRVFGHTNVLTLVCIISRIVFTMALITIKKARKELHALIKRDAYREGTFQLSSGLTSSYYIDCRKVTLSSNGAYLTAYLILEAMKNKKIDAIGGPTIGADPIVGAVSVLSLVKYKNSLKAFLVRRFAKSHGTKRQIEGPALKRGSRVIVVDDVATSGGSLLEAIAALRKRGLKVAMVIVIVDRGEGAKARLRSVGCPMHSIFTIDDFKSKKLRLKTVKKR